jgi:hypothetical protein
MAGEEAWDKNLIKVAGKYFHHPVLATTNSTPARVKYV